MLTRLAIIAIVAFWVVMNGALLRLWLDPDGGELLPVPVEHLVRQVFAHEQISDLIITQGGQPIGGVLFQPRQLPEGGGNRVDISGRLTAHLPMTEPQPFRWNGSIDLDEALALRQMRLEVDAAATGVRFSLEIDRDAGDAGEARCVIAQEGEEPFGVDVPLTQDGLGHLLAHLGVDLGMISRFAGSAPTSGESPLEVRAVQARVFVAGEATVAYRLTVRHSGSTLLELEVSQLGQILAMRSPLGFGLEEP